MFANANESISPDDLYYFRQRNRNRIFASVIARFSQLVETKGLTKREIAFRLHKEPSQITRWLSGPSNWTLDTYSDLLLAMEGSELDYTVTQIEQQTSSSAETHPLASARHGNVIWDRIPMIEGGIDNASQHGTGASTRPAQWVKTG
jgi:hypothetical protein